MPPIVVDVGKQMNGATFLLDYRTEAMLSAQIPGWAPPSDRVFLGFDKPWDWERIQGPMWTQIVMLLTGLSEKQIRDLGGFVFIMPSGKEDNEIVFEARAA
jgi:hypothetical protein